MHIEVTERLIRIVVVAPHGRVDTFTVPQLRARLEELLAEGVINFVIDLRPTPFLDSAGMAALVSVLKRTRQLKGDTKLVWPAKEDAQRILRLTRFDRVFEMSETVDEAIDRFQRA